MCGIFAEAELIMGIVPKRDNAELNPVRAQGETSGKVCDESEHSFVVPLPNTASGVHDEQNVRHSRTVGFCRIEGTTT